jgi:rifampin ADP-ribosylating transferase
MPEERTAWTAHLSTGPSVPVVSQGEPRGIPLVLLHAWGESSSVFDRLLNRLPSDQWAVSFDQRGHGSADRPESGYTLRHFAADVVAFLDELAVPSAVLLGSSSGGYVAQQVAAERPDRVAGLVLVGAPRTLQAEPSFAAEVAQLTDPVAPEWVRSSIAWFPMFSRVPEWFIEDRISDGVAVPARVWHETLRGLVEAVPPTRGGRVVAPTLVLYGGRDDAVRLEEEEALTASIPGARLVVYEDTGHLVLWEHPKRVARDTVGFLEGADLRVATASARGRS